MYLETIVLRKELQLNRKTGPSSEDQFGKKQSNVVELKDKEEFFVFVTIRLVIKESMGRNRLLY